jgi:hypothetical protein
LKAIDEANNARIASGRIDNVRAHGERSGRTAR